MWDRAIKGASENELTAASRPLQDEILEHRKRDTPVFDWLYNRLRKDHEQQMRVAAARMIGELEATNKSAG